MASEEEVGHFDVAVGEIREDDGEEVGESCTGELCLFDGGIQDLLGAASSSILLSLRLGQIHRDNEIPNTNPRFLKTLPSHSPTNLQDPFLTQTRPTHRGCAPGLTSSPPPRL